MQAGAGVVWHARPGDEVAEGQPLFTLLTDEPERFDRALASLEGGYDVADDASRRPDGPGARPDRLSGQRLPNSDDDLPCLTFRVARAYLLAFSTSRDRGGTRWQTQRRRGPAAPRRCSTAVLAVVVLVTGLAVGAGATWFACPATTTGPPPPTTGAPSSAGSTSPSPRRCTAWSWPPSRTSRPTASRSTRRCGRASRSPAAPRLGSRLPGRLDPGGALRGHRGLPRPGRARPEAAREEPGPHARAARGRQGGAALRVVGRRRGVGPGPVPNPESSVAGALAVTAPEAEARAVGRTRDAARQLLVPFAQAQGARTVDGEDATVQPAMFARALAAAGGRHRAAAGDGGRSRRPPRPDPGRGRAGPRLPAHGRSDAAPGLACAGPGARRSTSRARWVAR